MKMPLRNRIPFSSASSASVPLRATAVGLLLAAPILPAAASPSAPGLSSIRLTATPPIIRADGHSTTYINAEVFDERGDFVPDGTRVRFTTTGGSARLDTGVATTKNGVARVLLTAPNQPGETFVAATVEGAGQSVPVQIKIAFTLDADASETGTTWEHIDGKDYLGYAADSAVVQADGKGGNARFSYRSLSVSADTLQYSARENRLLASGSVTLKQNGTERTYSTLSYNPLTAQGVGERVVDGKPEYFRVHGSEAAEEPFGIGLHPGPNDFLADDLSEARIVIVARSIDLEPNRKLQFRRATFYLDGQKTVSLPFHVMALGQDGLFADPLFGYNAGGLSVDLPFYYDVRPNGIGTIHARRGARIGDSAFATRQGWSIDASQAYNGSHNQEGTIELLGINRSDWAARFRHGQQLDKATSANLYIDSPGGIARGLFASTQATRTYSGFNMNASLSGSRAPGVTDSVTGTKGQASGDIRGQIGATTHEKPLWGSVKTPVHYTLTTDFTRQSDYGRGTTGISQGVIYSNTTGAQLFTSPLPVARQTTLSQSVSLGQTWVRATSKNGQTAEGISLLGTTSLNRSLGNLGNTTLSYNYLQTPLYQVSNAASAVNGKQRLDLTAYLSGSRNWNLTLNGSQGVDSPQQSLFTKLEVVLGGPWRGHVRFSNSRLGGISYKETEYALFRRILGRDVGVYYSTTSRRVQLDLARVGF